MSLPWVEPGHGLRFVVVIDGTPLGNWQKCEGLTVTYKTENYEEGGQNTYTHKLPGRIEYENIKLTRPVDPASSRVAQWVESIALSAKRSTGAITVLDASGIPVTMYQIYGVYPAKYSGPSFDVSSKNYAMETLELVHTGFLGPG